MDLYKYAVLLLVSASCSSGKRPPPRMTDQQASPAAGKNTPFALPLYLAIGGAERLIGFRPGVLPGRGARPEALKGRGMMEKGNGESVPNQGREEATPGRSLTFGARIAIFRSSSFFSFGLLAFYA